jgi:hypothetical protein
MAIKQWIVSGVIVTAATFAATASAQTADMYTIEYVQANLVKGQTTKQQVLQAFGEPTSKKAKLTSSGGASETFVYMKNAPKKASTGKGRFGSMLNSVTGAASSAARLAGGAIPGGAFAAAALAQHSVNAVDTASAIAGQQAEVAADGASTLVIQLQEGVVSSFAME